MIESRMIKECNYKDELDSFLSFLDAEKDKCFGIQINQETEDCLEFAPFLKHTLNNLGDPFLGKGGHLHTFGFERKLVNIMADLLKIAPEEAWGYYTSGSSISNLQAIHFAATKVGNSATLITSEDAHNSIIKAAHIVRLKNVIKVQTNANGEIDEKHFKEILWSLPKNDKLIFCFCSGSVSKGAYDNVERLLQIVKQLEFNRKNYYVHLDAALGGLITPFLTDSDLKLDFRVPEIDSISTSFHKRLGIPMPGSVFIARKSVLNFFESMPFIEDYSSIDSTIPGSRDGLSPLITYFKLKRYGFENMVKRTKDVIDKAQWFADKLQKNGIEGVLHNENSPCVFFKAPADDTLIKEYHLPIYRNEKGEKFTHIFTMEHVSKTALLKFINKIKIHENTKLPRTA